MTEFHTSERGLAVDRSFEGCSLKAYRDEVGVITIGFGSIAHDCALLGINLTMDTRITMAQAEQLLRISVARLYEGPTNAAMASPRLTQQAFDGGGSFTYNLGGGAIQHAAWVRQWKANGDASGILAYNHAGGHVLAGLTRRRKRELAIIMHGDYGPEGAQTVLTDEHGKVIKGATVSVPIQLPTQPAWLLRFDAARGVYAAQNDAAWHAMATQANDPPAQPLAWLAIDWALFTTGYGHRANVKRIAGPALGALVQYPNQGFVGMVRGKSDIGNIVAIGTIAPGTALVDVTIRSDIATYWWPARAVRPAKVGLDVLPSVVIRTPGPRAVDHPALDGLHNAPHLWNTPGMLMQGSTGDEVKDLQKTLVARGYKIAVTGTYDAATSKAVTDWQHRHGMLNTDGVAGPTTIASLKRANAASQIPATGGKGAATTAAGAAANAVTGGHLSWAVVAVGVAAAALVIYLIWHYRTEIKALFTAKAQPVTAPKA